MLLPPIHIHLSKWKWIIADHLFVQIYMEGFIKKNTYDICVFLVFLKKQKNSF